MSELVAAIGVALVLEGVGYALFPQAMRRMLARIAEASADMMRIGGAVAVAAGVAIVWLARA